MKNQRFVLRLFDLAKTCKVWRQIRINFGLARLTVLASLALSSSVLNLPKAFQTIPSIGIVCLLHLSPTYESKLSTLSLNEEAPTLHVEALWSRQESNLDLVFRKHLLLYRPNFPYKST
jgi:hypothetical protein